VAATNAVARQPRPAVLDTEKAQVLEKNGCEDYRLFIFNYDR